MTDTDMERIQGHATALAKQLRIIGPTVRRIGDVGTDAAVALEVDEALRQLADFTSTALEIADRLILVRRLERACVCMSAAEFAHRRDVLAATVGEVA